VTKEKSFGELLCLQNGIKTGEVIMIKVLLFASHYLNPNLSYYWDWFENLYGFEDFNADVINTTKGSAELFYNLWKRRKNRYDLIIYPYGFFYKNNDNRSLSIFELFSNLNGKKIFFLENEYRLLNQKFAMAQILNAEYVTTQLPIDNAIKAYSAFWDPEKIIPLPHGINNKNNCIKSIKNNQEREIDLYFQGTEYPYYIGHQDRAIMAKYFEVKSKDYNLKIQCNLKHSERLNRDAWHNFLSNCKGVLAHESGSDFLETNDVNRLKITNFINEHPRSTFKEIYDLFFRNNKFQISGRCISSRHFDAINAKCCQIMFPGRYNDILYSNEHFIKVERDFSNVDEVMEKFLDKDLNDQITKRAYEYSMDSQTISHRIKYMIDFVEKNG
jgi:hypothetical protein